MNVNGALANGTHTGPTEDDVLLPASAPQSVPGTGGAPGMTGFPPPDNGVDPLENEVIGLRGELAALQDRITRSRAESELAAERQRNALREVVESTQATLHRMERDHQRDLEKVRLETEQEIRRIRDLLDSPGSGEGATS